MSQLLHKIFIAVVFSGGLILALFGLGPLLDPEKANFVLQHTSLLIFALSACIVGGIAFVWLMEGFGGPLSWPWQKMVLMIDVPHNILLNHVRTTLRSIGAHIGKDTDVFLCATKGSWWGIGGKQVITVHCVQRDGGTCLTVRSRPWLITALVDGGQNATNVAEICLALKEHFRKQLVMTRNNHRSQVLR